MARQVTGTTSNVLNVLTGEAIPYPLSISCRFKTPAQQANCTPIFYGETYPSWDGDYVSISSAAIGASTGKAANFFGASVAVSLVPNRWYLVVCVFASSASRTIYLDNSTQSATNTTDSGPPLNTNKNLTVGSLLTSAPPAGFYPTAGFDGEIADVAIWNTALTAADVDNLAAGRPSNVKLGNLKGWWKLGSDGSLANSVGNYPAMTVYGTCPATADPTYNTLADPAEVPPAYGIDTSLSWVQKATHIWALHPNDPLKADKGGNNLELVTGTPAVPSIAPDNTMQFHQGAAAFDASYYRTLAPFIFGDDPVTTGNQTPPVIGAFSCWFYLTALPPANFAHIVGQASADSNIDVFYSTVGGVRFSAGGTSTGAGVPLPLNRWAHICGTNDATFERLYINGIKVKEIGPSANINHDEVMGIGYAPRIFGTPYGVDGRIRLVSVINGAIWTDAEILEQYERPFAYYGGDPTSVPSYYKPNTDLAWVTKATHIWAVHPSNPLKADKGGMTLQETTRGSGGTAPTALASPENTMEFHGAHETAAIWYATIDPFIFGDDPLTAGNQTPPMIGAMSGWFYLYSYAEWLHLMGMAGPASNGLTTAEGAHVTCRQSTASMLATVGSNLAVFGQPQPPLNTWTHIAVTNDATYKRVYVNGVKTGEAADNSGAGVSLPFNIGHTVYASAAQRFTFDGRIRLVAVVQGAIWTDAEIAEQANRPYAYYKPDPSHVPDTYSPNTDLAWVQKATHIWAVHPNDPLKADKGGLTLQLAGAGDDPVVLGAPYNIIEFQGGKWYETIGSFIFGDNPAVAGNQTPPAIGAISCWVFPYLNTRSAFVGQWANPDQSDSAHTVAMYQQNISGNSTLTGSCGTTTTNVFGLPLTQWVHVAYTNDGSFRRLYINGVKVVEGTNNSLAMFDRKLQIAHNERPLAGAPLVPFYGAMRLVAVVNGTTWTDAEILEQYQRPYAYYSDLPPFTGIHADAGNFALGGQPAQFLRNRIWQADAGAYSLAGEAAGSLQTRVIASDAGAFLLAGQGVALNRGRNLVSGAGDFALTGQPAFGLRGYLVTASTDVLVLAGGDVLALYGRVFPVATGVYLLNGQPAMLIKPAAGKGRHYIISGDSMSCGTQGATPTWTQDPDARLDYTFDWSPWLGEDKITDHIITTNLTIESSSHTDTEVIVWLSGGQQYKKYPVTCHIQTQGGREDDRSLVVYITQK